LDLIAYPEIFGSLAVAVETLENQISNLDIGRLIDYGLRYNVGSVIKRLGWILDTLGVSADILLPLKDYRVQNDYLLDPQRPRDGNRNPGWRIIENLIRDE
jgi:predicted transcriptional regulator of viral defense system